DRVLEREPALLTLCPADGTIEAALARDDDALGDVAQDGVRGREVRPDRDRTGRAARLPPDDLTPEEEREVVLQNAHDVAGERPVRLATEVGDVQGDAAAGLEHPAALGEDVTEHREVLEVGAGHVPFTEGRFVVLAGEVWR